MTPDGRTPNEGPPLPSAFDEDPLAFELTEADFDDDLAPGDEEAAASHQVDDAQRLASELALETLPLRLPEAPGTHLDLFADLSEPLPQDSPVKGHALAGPLRLAADARDEERFLALVERVLHEPDDVAVSLLVPYLGRGGAVGRVAAHGLLMLGAPALEALLAGVRSDDAVTRQAAAWALGSLRDKRATQALVEALDRPDASPELIQACLESLAELGDRAAVPILLAKLREPTFADFRPGLCRALGHIGDPQAISRIVPLLATPKPMVRLRAAEALVRLLDKRGWPVLFALLRGDDARGESTVAALRGLGELSSALASFLGDDDYHTRRDAAEVLGSFGDTRAVQPLIDALGDINPWVRGAAAYALGRLGDRKGFKFLLMTLKDDSAWVRQSTVRALGLLGDARARKPLEEMLFDPDPDISSAAQEALNALADR